MVTVSRKAQPSLAPTTPPKGGVFANLSTSEKVSTIVLALLSVVMGATTIASAKVFGLFDNSSSKSNPAALDDKVVVGQPATKKTEEKKKQPTAYEKFKQKAQAGSKAVVQAVQAHPRIAAAVALGLTSFAVYGTVRYFNQPVTKPLNPTNSKPENSAGTVQEPKASVTSTSSSTQGSGPTTGASAKVDDSVGAEPERASTGVGLITPGVESAKAGSSEAKPKEAAVSSGETVTTNSDLTNHKPGVFERVMNTLQTGAASQAYVEVQSLGLPGKIDLPGTAEQQQFKAAESRAKVDANLVSTPGVKESSATPQLTQTPVNKGVFARALDFCDRAEGAFNNAVWSAWGAFVSQDCPEAQELRLSGKLDNPSVASASESLVSSTPSQTLGEHAKGYWEAGQARAKDLKSSVNHAVETRLDKASAVTQVAGKALANDLKSSVNHAVESRPWLDKTLAVTQVARKTLTGEVHSVAKQAIDSRPWLRKLVPETNAGKLQLVVKAALGLLALTVLRRNLRTEAARVHKANADQRQLEEAARIAAEKSAKAAAAKRGRGKLRAGVKERRLEQIRFHLENTKRDQARKVTEALVATARKEIDVLANEYEIPRRDVREKMKQVLGPLPKAIENQAMERYYGGNPLPINQVYEEVMATAAAAAVLDIPD